MFLRKYWIPLLSVFIVAIVGVGLYYLQTQPPKEPIVIYTPVEPIEKPTEEPKAEVSPVGDTSQGGHVHADGNPFHEETHAPADITEVPPEVQGARDIAIEANAQATTPIQALQEARATFDAWEIEDWELKHQGADFLRELLDLMPETVEGWERFVNDDPEMKAVKSGMREVFEKIDAQNKIIEAHKKERPFPVRP